MDLDQLNRFFNPWKRRIMGMVRRLTITGTDETKGLERVQIETLKDVVQENIERLQNYGFNSRPLDGAEGVILYLGGNQDHGVVIAVDDMRYRLKTLEKGEVALYSDEGDFIHLKRGNQINIKTSKLNIVADAEVNITAPKANVTASNEVKVTTAKATVIASGNVDVSAANANVTATTKASIMAPTVDITAPTGVNMTTPTLTVSGLVACAGIGAGVPPVAGSAKVSGSIEATGDVKDSAGSMAQIRTKYNGHTHGGVQSGSSSTSSPTPPM